MYDVPLRGLALGMGMGNAATSRYVVCFPSGDVQLQLSFCFLFGKLQVTWFTHGWGRTSPPLSHSLHSSPAVGEEPRTTHPLGMPYGVPEAATALLTHSLPYKLARFARPSQSWPAHCNVTALLLQPLLPPWSTETGATWGPLGLIHES